MRQLGLVVALLILLVLVSVAIPVAAQEEFDPHPHMLLQRPEIGLIDGAPFLLGIRKCVDLAGNQPVPLHAHHERLHFGDAGISFGGEARHAVIPAAHFPTVDDPLPWANCAEFEALIPFPVGG